MRTVARLSFAFLILTLGLTAAVRKADAQAGGQPASQPLNIIAFGAHPDDCDIRAGGTAAKWAAAGHQRPLRLRDQAATRGTSRRAAARSRRGDAPRRRRLDGASASTTSPSTTTTASWCRS